MKERNREIKKFEIQQLFGLYNVSIIFNDKINIFIGENGIGKTTILNCLYYVLNGKIIELCKIEFESIVLTVGREKIRINHDLLLNYNEIIENEDDYLGEYRISDYVFLIAKYCKKNKKNRKRMKEYSLIVWNDLKINEKYPFSRIQTYRIIEKIDNENIYKWGRIVEEFKDSLIFLPTYRRIEEDFNEIINVRSNKYRRITSDINGLNFGMNDVKEKIKKICDELKTQTSEGFKEMTSNLLSGYVKLGDAKSLKKRKTKIANTELNIIFERLADRIDTSTKKAIISEYENSNENNEFKQKYLNIIIDSLHSIYKKTRKLDKDLDDFVNVCNKYMKSCYLLYDKYKIECKLINKTTNKEIDFDSLSSGEKQIVSLFAKIYLSGSSDNILLFDEPELSLSIIWQETLLPDIFNSKKCDFAFIVSHSPYIINNDFQKNAKFMSSCITTK